MRLRCAGAPLLTYCTNIHPGESWAEVRANLERYVPAVKRRVSPEAPFAVGLRLSARAVEELLAPGEIERLRAFLAENDLSVPTLNGFPHGVFHGTAVKEAVYRPDWLEPARLSYSNMLADVLAALLPEGGRGTVSTVPGAFRPRVAAAGAGAAERMAESLVAHAAHLHDLRERTGKTVLLALEPEPFCHLETAADAVAFFEEHLFSRAAATLFASTSGAALSAAEEALRRHLGVCYDACHGAVELEDPAAALGALGRAGITVGKIQVSAGLEVDFEAGDRRALLGALRPFAEGVYFHQVVARTAWGIESTLDLPEAIAAAASDPVLLDRLLTWRIHFHVPIFREALGPFRSTQPFLRDLLAIVVDRAVCDVLEVETYTWDVLPAEHRIGAIDEAIARELLWARGRLEP